MASTEARMGPMHGVHPKPNAAPATGAAKGPNRDGLGWKRASAYIHEARSRAGRPARELSTSEPTRKAAMTSTATPESRVSRTWLRNRTWPTAVADSPSRMKTAEKPATNRVVSRVMRPRWWRGPERTSATSRPVTTDR